MRTPVAHVAPPLLILLGILILAGCTTTQHNYCPFWDTVPYDQSQDLWRAFDCP